MFLLLPHPCNENEAQKINIIATYGKLYFIFAKKIHNHAHSKK